MGAFSERFYDQLRADVKKALHQQSDSGRPTVVQALRERRVEE